MIIPALAAVDNRIILEAFLTKTARQLQIDESAVRSEFNKYIAQHPETGQLQVHEAQEAVKLGIVIADGGHFGTERSSMTVLLQRLQAASIERNWEVVWKEDSTSCDIFKHC